MTKVIRTVSDFLNFRSQLNPSLSVGFVPTMGALHNGHESLLQKSKSDTDLSVLSIFVNPTQFNSSEDLIKYPRTWDQDLELAQRNKVDVVFAPEYSELYKDHYRYRISENDFSKILCGKYREGHFDGVLTIVMKLLQLVRPQKAFFGEKDFQQFLLIKDMTKSFFLNTEICPCPTVRDMDGLAQSSRNVRLSLSGRAIAPKIYRAISQSTSIAEARHVLENENIEVEYLEEHFGRRFVAAYIDGVRLIDNVAI